MFPREISPYPELIMPEARRERVIGVESERATGKWIPCGGGSVGDIFAGVGGGEVEREEEDSDEEED